MFAHVKCFVLAVLVVESLSAPAPGIYRVGGSHGAAGSTSVNVGARGKGTLKDGVADGKGSVKLGLSGSGTVDGSTFMQVDGKIVEAAGDYHGSAGGWVRPVATGSMGKNTNNGKMVLGGNVKSDSNSEHSGAGSAGIYTNEDALVKFHEHQSRSAKDILQELDDEDY